MNAADMNLVDRDRTQVGQVKIRGTVCRACPSVREDGETRQVARLTSAPCLINSRPIWYQPVYPDSKQHPRERQAIASDPPARSPSTRHNATPSAPCHSPRPPSPRNVTAHWRYRTAPPRLHVSLPLPYPDSLPCAFRLVACQKGEARTCDHQCAPAHIVFCVDIGGVGQEQLDHGQGRGGRCPVKRCPAVLRLAIVHHAPYPAPGRRGQRADILDG